MGFPKCRKLTGDITYEWTFNLIEPIAPIEERIYRRPFDDLKDHPSGRIIGLSSVGTRVQDYPSHQLVFPLQLDLSADQTEALRQFFSDSAFWFFPDSDIDIGYLVSYFPKDFQPEPTASARFILSGGLVQLDKRILNLGSSTSTPIDIPDLQYDQQATVRSGISLWINDKELIDNDGALVTGNTHAIYAFPEPEVDGSDWTLLNNHFIRHETNYIDRRDRILFNWVREVKNRYRFIFRAINGPFLQKLLRFTAQRIGRFYPAINDAFLDDTLTEYILPPNGDDLHFVNVRVVEPELEVEYYNGLYDTIITFEEI